MHEEIKSWLSSGSACCYSVQDLMSSTVLSKDIRIEIYTNIITTPSIRGHLCTAKRTNWYIIPHFKMHPTIISNPPNNIDGGHKSGMSDTTDFVPSATEQCEHNKRGAFSFHSLPAFIYLRVLNAPPSPIIWLLYPNPVFPPQIL